MKNPYIEALSDIARSLRGVEPAATVAWNVELLPEQVGRELRRLRLEVSRLEREVERSRARGGGEP